ncbi:MAG TPA: addiction module toxin RelE [Serratia grimesii]|uniref:Addiction module toxin RelE n=1 Tax=Serratia grimesii TaxID=82995 RepID=A0A9C7R1Q9_9GAMM|nr:addiction module toxin RelE [Serratia grimesii]
MADEHLYPKDFKLRQGGNLTNPWELSSLSDEDAGEQPKQRQLGR